MRKRELIQGEISKHIFMPNGGIIILQVFFTMCMVLKIGEINLDIPRFSDILAGGYSVTSPI